jgi:hypothetical protein
LGAQGQILSRYRYLTPNDSRKWIRKHHGRPPPTPHTGEALMAWDHLQRMRLEERNAAALLSLRDVDRRFKRATWIILVGSLVAGGLS